MNGLRVKVVSLEYVLCVYVCVCVCVLESCGLVCVCVCAGVHVVAIRVFARAPI